MKRTGFVLILALALLTVGLALISRPATSTHAQPPTVQPATEQAPATGVINLTPVGTVLPVTDQPATR